MQKLDSAAKLALDGGAPTRKEFLHFHRASIGEAEEQEVLACLKSGWLTTGPRTKAFETAFAKYTGAKHAIAMNSCTAALHVSLIALGVGPGDEVITSPLTWCSTANVIVHSGATPVFADVNPDTLCIDPASIAKRVTKKTKAIIPVDYAGQPTDLDAIAAAAPGIPVIEDAAHATETVYKGKKVGAISTTTCFSFYATKNMTTAEGGMLTTNDDSIADKARVLSQHGVSRDAWNRYTSSGFKRYQVIAAGFKYNMPDITAALGLKQLEKVDSWLAPRRNLVARYRELFARTPGMKVIQQLEGKGNVNAFHLLPILVDDASKRDWIMAAIQAENVGVGIHFPAVNLEPFYREKYGCKPGDCPVAESAASRTLSLPLYPSLTHADQDTVVAAVEKVMSQLDRAR